MRIDKDANGVRTAPTAQGSPTRPGRSALNVKDKKRFITPSIQRGERAAAEVIHDRTGYPILPGPARPRLARGSQYTRLESRLKPSR